MLALEEHVRGAKNPDTLNTCYNLALCLEEQQKLKEALTYAQRALTGRLKVLGKNDADTKAAQELVDELMKKLAAKA